jgi:hypothetical protein
VDIQLLFDVAVGIAGGFGFWILTRLTRSIDKIEDKLDEVPEKYVSKDDYRTDLHEIKSMLLRISEKLDAKADR